MVEVETVGVSAEVVAEDERGEAGCAGIVEGDEVFASDVFASVELEDVSAVALLTVASVVVQEAV